MGGLDGEHNPDTGKNENEVLFLISLRKTIRNRNPKNNKNKPNKNEYIINSCFVNKIIYAFLYHNFI